MERSADASGLFGLPRQQWISILLSFLLPAVVSILVTLGAYYVKSEVRFRVIEFEIMDVKEDHSRMLDRLDRIKSTLINELELQWERDHFKWLDTKPGFPKPPS